MENPIKLIGIDKQIGEIKEFIQNWKKSKSLLLVGSSGTGKTSSINYVCKELGYNIWEVDFTEIDFETLIQKCKLKPIQNTLIVIDNIHEFTNSQQNKLIKLIKESNIPIVITSHNEYQVNDEIVKMSKVVHFYKPKADVMLSVADEVSKQYNLKPNYKAFKGDLRQVIYSIFGSRGYESEESLLQIVKNYFNKLELDEVNNKILITILGNSHKFYGFYVYLLVKALSISDKTKRVEPLKLEELKYGGQVVSSYFFEKLKLANLS